MANDIKIINAILSINSNAKVVVSGAVLDTCNIQWMDGTAEISKADIETKITELQNVYDGAGLVQRNRAKEYPSIVDQLDLLYKDMLAGKGDKTGKWFKAVKKVKDDNPKD